MAVISLDQKGYESAVINLDGLSYEGAFCWPPDTENRFGDVWKELHRSDITFNDESTPVLISNLIHTLQSNENWIKEGNCFLPFSL